MQALFLLRRLLRTVVVFALVLLVLVLLERAVSLTADWLTASVLAGVALLLALLASWGRRWVPRRTWIEMDLERGVVERPPARRPFALGRQGPYLLRDVLDALERAGEDPRVVGLVARVGSFRPGLAVAQELRCAIQAFRAHGKRAIAFAETIGEGASATPEYYVASAFEEIHLQPSGLVGLDGLLLRQPFAKEALTKLGVEPQLGHRREYKTARNMFTETTFTEPHREWLQAVLDDVTGQVVEGIAAGRALEPAVVRDLIDQGPFTAKAALEAGLVDQLSWRDEVYALVRDEQKGRLLWVDAYLRRVGRPHRRGARVALVHATGVIHRGKGKARGASIGSDDVAKAIRKAAGAKRVRAILLRVDSPGGSAVASETIWREVARARERGKPVVVSMGDVAGSGGYYIACGADRIVAQPTTLTGSIGVVLGKFVTHKAWAKLGIRWASIQEGKNADLWSPTEDLGEKGWERVEGLLDSVYDDFKEKVALGRTLTPERVEAVAKGRVWSGTRAHELGLVDALGGRTKALELVREVAGLGADASLRLATYYPRRRGPLAALRAPENSEALLRHLQGALQAIDPALGTALAEASDRGGMLRMPPLHLA